MGIPPQFPPPDRPESDDFTGQDSGGSEFLHAEPLPRELIQRDLFRAEAFASFALVSWMLVRSTRMLEFGVRDSDPIAVVKLELGSLAHGDMQDAYAQLSERYRKEVPFANYNALVVSHRRMFLTREYRVTRHELHDGQMQIDAQLVSVNG